MDDREKFYKAMAEYYKNERNRTEDCLGGIIDIAGNDKSVPERFEAILNLLVIHYSRAA